MPLPPDPIVTRWGTWIKCGAFLCQNFTKIEEFIAALEIDSKAVEVAKKIVADGSVKDELFNVATFNFLPDVIEKLEMQKVEKEIQWSVFEGIRPLLHDFAKQKLVSSLEKNPDVLNFATNIHPEFRLKTKFAPLVSVDVELSFSQYKQILSDRRRNLTFANIEMYNVISYNKFLFDNNH